MKICAHLDCERQARTRSLCTMHYQRMLRARTGEQKQVVQDELKEKRAARPPRNTQAEPIKPVKFDQYGSCVSLSTDELERIFYPPGYDAPGFDIRKWDEARALCIQCPVRETCMEAGIQRHEVSRHTGIWGATTPSQRAAQIQKRNKQKVAA